MGLSAKRLGEKIGLTAEETNTLLKEAGYQSGQAGEYVVTETGKKFVEEKSWDNGCGGWCIHACSSCSGSCNGCSGNCNANGCSGTCGGGCSRTCGNCSGTCASGSSCSAGYKSSELYNENKSLIKRGKWYELTA